MKEVKEGSERAMCLRAIWVVALAIMGFAPLISQDDIHGIRFTISVSTPARKVTQGAVVVVFVEMRNSSHFPVLVSAGYRDPPIELHLWNRQGDDLVRKRNAEIADGSAFKTAATERPITLRFAPGESVRFRIYIPLLAGEGEYRIGVRTAVQMEPGQSQTAVVVDSNRLPILIAHKQGPR